MEDLRIPRYLNALPQLAWWEVDEAAPMVALVGVGLMMDFLLVAVLIGFTITRILARLKLYKPDGYLFHYLYTIGLTECPEFPSYLIDEFVE
jgi:conjugal transfer pilus assembly protein TraL